MVFVVFVMLTLAPPSCDLTDRWSWMQRKHYGSFSTGSHNTWQVEYNCSTQDESILKNHLQEIIPYVSNIFLTSWWSVCLISRTMKKKKSLQTGSISDQSAPILSKAEIAQWVHQINRLSLHQWLQSRILFCSNSLPCMRDGKSALTNQSIQKQFYCWRGAQAAFRLQTPPHEQHDKPETMKSFISVMNLNVHHCATLSILSIQNETDTSRKTFL